MPYLVFRLSSKAFLLMVNSSNKNCVLGLRQTLYFHPLHPQPIWTTWPGRYLSLTMTYLILRCSCTEELTVSRTDTRKDGKSMDLPTLSPKYIIPNYPLYFCLWQKRSVWKKLIKTTKNLSQANIQTECQSKRCSSYLNKKCWSVQFCWNHYRVLYSTIFSLEPVCGSLVEIKFRI